MRNLSNFERTSIGFVLCAVVIILHSVQIWKLERDLRDLREGVGSNCSHGEAVLAADGSIVTVCAL